jgi:hypothetical protein
MRNLVRVFAGFKENHERNARCLRKAAQKTKVAVPNQIVPSNKQSKKKSRAIQIVRKTVIEL